MSELCAETFCGGNYEWNRFQIARVRQGRSQLEVARQIGMHPTRLSKIENGWERPREDEVLAIRAALKLGDSTTDELAASAA
jgi:transcriptional regulator with XRE-family HTH domain